MSGQDRVPFHLHLYHCPPAQAAAAAAVLSRHGLLPACMHCCVTIAVGEHGGWEDTDAGTRICPMRSLRHGSGQPHEPDPAGWGPLAAGEYYREDATPADEVFAGLVAAELTRAAPGCSLVCWVEGGDFCAYTPGLGMFGIGGDVTVDAGGDIVVTFDEVTSALAAYPGDPASALAAVYGVAWLDDWRAHQPAQFPPAAVPVPLGGPVPPLAAVLRHVVTPGPDELVAAAVRTLAGDFLASQQHGTNRRTCFPVTAGVQVSAQFARGADPADRHLDVPGDLIRDARAAIDGLGDAAPLHLKMLWGYLDRALPAEQRNFTS
jgi:hypothetical protein